MCLFQTIKQMVSQKTIQVFDGVAGHSKSFYMGSDGTLLKRNTASGIMAKNILFQTGSKLATFFWKMYSRLVAQSLIYIYSNRISSKNIKTIASSTALLIAY